MRCRIGRPRKRALSPDSSPEHFHNGSASQLMSGHGMSYMSSPSIVANDTESSTASLSVPRLSFNLTSSAESTTQLSSLMNGMATAGVHDFSKRPTSSMQVPQTSLASSTLSDLSLAAFVESLYTLETVSYTHLTLPTKA